MDLLAYKTYDKALTLQELGLHENPNLNDGKYFNGTYEAEKYLIVWLGKMSEEGIEEYFNVYTTGQDAMDFFSTLRTAILLPAPEMELNLL